MIKIHKAVVGSRYFNITNVLVPLVFVIIGTIYRFFIGGVYPEIFVFIQAWLMIYEISTEYFGYGAIYRKNNFGMEYLKTSINGMDLVKKSMLSDSILRIIRTIAYTLLPGILVSRSVDDPAVIVVFALALANVSVWSVNFTRFVTMYGFLVMISSPFLIVGLIIDVLCINKFINAMPVIIALILLLAGGVIFTQIFASKKIKESYKDLM
ncbi:MAG: hypothetical protein J6Z05_05005 [Lachnospiraceae bacterium]|nr:hypothetical protein [Lachnospiraceae bacterium]